jgi:hypothetical protein
LEQNGERLDEMSTMIHGVCTVGNNRGWLSWLRNPENAVQDKRDSPEQSHAVNLRNVCGDIFRVVAGLLLNVAGGH